MKNLIASINNGFKDEINIPDFYEHEKTKRTKNRRRIITESDKDENFYNSYF
jgi:hypothetical protein